MPKTVWMLGALAAVLLALPALGAAPMASTSPAARSISSTGRSAFAGDAREVMSYIQKTFWDRRTGLYAHSTTERRPDAMWGNGVMFSALVAAAKQEPKAYRPILSRFFASLNRYWDSKAPIPGYEPWPTQGNGHDKYYDDNEWMVLGFLQAYDLTKEPRYLDRADEALRFALSGWDDALGGGIWWHEEHKDDTKNTCSNGPAAVGCLMMAKYRRRDENIQWARRIVAWTSEHLQDRNGLFYDSEKVGARTFNKDLLTYNTALMLRANLGLYRLTGEKHYLDEAKRISAACEWFVDSKSGAYRDNVKFAHLLVEADLAFSRATGDTKSLARARRNGQVSYERWRKKPPATLIENASIARMLWLLADPNPAKDSF
jgi:uncharacterized protein YyaL (SSP411 family)